VRFIEADRQASRELGVQWTMFGNSALANTGSGLPAAQLPITQPNGAFQQPARPISAAPMCSPRNCRLSRSSPAAWLFGRGAVKAFLVGSFEPPAGGDQCRLRCRAPPAASPSPEPWWRCRAIPSSFLAGGEFPGAGSRHARHGDDRLSRNMVSASPSTPTVLQRAA